MTTEAGTDKLRRRATRTGVVTKDKMDKSVVVRVDRTVKHDLYRRYVRRSSRFMAHDENNICKVGDTVEIVESRPLSSRKRWRVRRIVRSVIGGSTPAPAKGEG